MSQKEYLTFLIKDYIKWPTLNCQTGVMFFKSRDLGHSGNLFTLYIR